MAIKVVSGLSIPTLTPRGAPMSGSKHAERAKTGTTGAPHAISGLYEREPIAATHRVGRFGVSAAISGDLQA